MSSNAGQAGMPETLNDAIALLKQVEVENSQEVSAVLQYVAEVPQRIQDAVNIALGQGATPEQVQALTDLTSIIQSDTDKMKAAVQGQPQDGGKTESA